MITFNKLKKLSKKADNADKNSLKIAVLGDTATQMFTTALKGMLLNKNIPANVWEADYNQIQMQITSATSELHEFNPDYLVVFQATHKLLIEHSKSSPQDRSILAQKRLEFVKNIAIELPNLKIIYLNYPEINDSIFGSYSNKIEASFTYQIRKLNYELMNLASTTENLFICDLSSLQNRFGSEMMFLPNLYITSEIVLSLDILPYVASQITDIISAIRGSFKKCLILDLDNTIWGGIIGDDGIENIHIGYDLGIGKAFYEFQLWCKKLKQRGIILAVCSKNTQSIAEEPFKNHPNMVLKLDDIAVFIANWESKVDNIRRIQEILNIGFDSMVFLDDNPFERNVVREYIPDITVPELPEDPAAYLDFLYSQNLFETANISENDDKRTLQYQQESKRAILQKSFTNEDDFLKNLSMKSEVTDLNNFNIPRVAQLSQRSNQFNLRTIRYTDGDLKDMANKNNYIPIVFTLADSFGNNGLICVVILKIISETDAFIQSWFMSCRVLKRGMEKFTLNQLVEIAKKHNLTKIIGEYIPSPKNAMVSNHYENMGFTKDSNNDSSNKLYSLDVNTYKQSKVFIEKI